MLRSIACISVLGVGMFWIEPSWQSEASAVTVRVRGIAEVRSRAVAWAQSVFGQFSGIGQSSSGVAAAELAQERLTHDERDRLDRLVRRATQSD